MGIDQVIASSISHAYNIDQLKAVDPAYVMLQNTASMLKFNATSPLSDYDEALKRIQVEYARTKKLLEKGFKDTPNSAFLLSIYRAMGEFFQTLCQFVQKRELTYYQHARIEAMLASDALIKALEKYQERCNNYLTDKMLSASVVDVEDLQSVKDKFYALNWETFYKDFCEEYEKRRKILLTTPWNYKTFVCNKNENHPDAKVLDLQLEKMRKMHTEGIGHMFSYNEVATLSESMSKVYSITEKPLLETPMVEYYKGSMAFLKEADVRKFSKQMDRLIPHASNSSFVEILRKTVEQSEQLSKNIDYALQTNQTALSIDKLLYQHKTKSMQPSEVLDLLQQYHCSSVAYSYMQQKNFMDLWVNATSVTQMDKTKILSSEEFNNMFVNNKQTKKLLDIFDNSIISTVADLAKQQQSSTTRPSTRGIGQA